LNLYNDQALNQKLVFHNMKSTIQLVKYTSEISAGSDIPAIENEKVILAAWFCFSGYLQAYNDPQSASINQFQSFAKSENLNDALIKEVNSLLGIYFGASGDGKDYERVFKDAIKVLLYGPDFKVAQHLLQYEIELNGGVSMDKVALQNKLMAGFLSSQLIKKLDPNQGLQEIPPEAFSQIEIGIPNRGIQSYFRSNYRVHINLSAIADNKANIMISVNAILISVLISLLSYKNISETNPRIMLPVLLFIVAGLSSLIFAVLSARPKINYPNKGITDKSILRKNAIFFGSFVTMKLDEYEDVMDEMFQDGSLIYGNMIRDMYYLGKVLDKKYQYLIISYNIFMIGFALTVLSFLAILFIN